MAASDGQTVLARLLENVAATASDPSHPLDTRIFDQSELILPRSLFGQDRLSLIQTLATLLPQLQQDPTPVAKLLIHLTVDFTYADILAFGPDALPYVDGLAVGEQMVSVNRLMLTILEKATTKSADAAHVAGMLDTMLALVRLWLCTSDTGIASQASKLLLDLLRIDQDLQTDPDADLPEGGQGLVWKRIFGDRNIYGTFFEACSLTGPSSLKLSKSQRTLAQARLMEWLPAVGAMDWAAISKSHHSDIEQSYKTDGGLLQFAATSMVDISDDVLMHRCLVDFFSELLKVIQPAEMALPGHDDSPALLYLIKEGLHDRTAVIYIQSPGVRQDPMESMFLYGPAANYIATYASYYKQHFMTSDLRQRVIERLRVALDLSSARWAHADSPKHDLHLVASLPRDSVLPGGDGNGDWQSSPISLLPSRSVNPDVLNTLGTIFHGPEQQIVSFPPSSPINSGESQDYSEASAARTLYYHYLANNPRFWNDIATHADTVALKDLALAALNCLISVITANWSATPELALPSTIATPEQAYLAILSPPSLEYTLPYLLRPARTFANLVGGRGDAESAAYQIASAKFDALRFLHDKLVAHVEQNPGQGYEDIVATIAKRLAEGPMSREGEIGGSIGTLEL